MPLNHLYILLLKYPEKNWDWSWVSQNSCITMEIIENHLEWPWEWDYISQNKNITVEFIKSEEGHKLMRKALKENIELLEDSFKELLELKKILDKMSH